MEKKAQNSFDEVGKSGQFVRKPTAYHNQISNDSTEYPVESGRYHLYVSYACPWASRCLLFRKLKGLEEAIPLHVVAPRWGTVSTEGTRSWVFSDAVLGGVQCNDPLYGSQSLRQLYELNDPEYAGRYTVPVLWDSKTKKIVNNESAEIIRMFNSNFDSIAKHPQVDLRPAHLAHRVDELNDWMYERINNGVYKCGFATTQEAYEAAFPVLFDALDEVEKMLSQSRFLTGNDQPSEADLRLFVTIVRFDPVYVGHFKCNKKRIIDYPNLWGWVRDVYQWPGVKDTVNMYHIKEHYHGSHPSINPHGIVPVGPDIDYETPHGRDKMFPK